MNPATESLDTAIVEQAADAIIFADIRGIIQRWNAGAEAIFGLAAGEACGQSLDLIIPQRLRAAHWSAFTASMASGRTRYGRRALLTRSARKDGAKIYVELSFAVVRNAAGEVIGSLAIARDATDRQAADAALKQRVADLEALRDVPH